jgi:hypothetical protein
MGRLRTSFKRRVAIVVLNAFSFAPVRNFRETLGVCLLQVGDVVIYLIRIPIDRGGHPGERIVAARSRERQDAPNIGRGRVALGQGRKAEALFDGLKH